MMAGLHDPDYGQGHQRSTPHKYNGFALLAEALAPMGRRRPDEGRRFAAGAATRNIRYCRFVIFRHESPHQKEGLWPAWMVTTCL